MYSVYGSSFDPRCRLRFSFGTPGDRRYLRTEFREILNSLAIPRIDRP